MTTPRDLETKGSPNWCPGCGNFGIWNALKMAISELGLEPHNIVMTSGIGCSSKHPHWLRTYAFNGLHGRLIPLALGVKLANHKLKVIGTGGDGDGYAEGGNHFMHFCRHNIGVTYIVHNNQIYGLTKGQASPTSDEGFVTKTTPYGTVEKALNPVLVALAAGATFVARGYAGNINQLKELMKRAIMHKGAAILDILQPCVTFNKVNTYDWYTKRVYELKEQCKTRIEAMTKASEWGDKIPIGVFYESNEPSYEERLPQLKVEPLAKQELNTDIKHLLEELK